MIFYVDVLLVFPVLFKKRKFFLFIILQSCILIVNGYLRFVIYAFILPKYGLIDGYSYSLWTTYVISFGWWLHYTLYALGFYYFKEAIKKERQLRLVEQHNSKLKEEKLQTAQRRLQSDYAFLRAQINPHFLHNTLSYFYSRSLNGHSEELSEAILTLSDVMRYALEERGASIDKVALAEEVEHIQNIIKLNRMRFSSTLQLDFEIKGNVRGIYIIPLILITLVENTFKHGELTDPQHPISILLEISKDGNELRFVTHNKKKRGPVEQSTSIGMENTRKRLDMVYGENYKLDVKRSDDFYQATLCINLRESYKGTDTYQYKNDLSTIKTAEND